MQRNVLVIEDQQDIAELVELHLKDLNCRAKLAFDGIAGLAEAESGQYDLIILDLMLPGMDGLEVCKRVRARSRYTPILMLTSKSSELDRVLGLELGADDYLTKPFSVPELLARMRVALRHAAGKAGVEEPIFSTGDLVIDRARRVVTVRGEEVHLTPTEYRLLLALAQHAGRVLTHRHLLREVWGPGRVGQDHYLRVYMAQLRAKIERDSARPEYLRTEPGVGYRMLEAE